MGGFVHNHPIWKRQERPTLALAERLAGWVQPLRDEGHDLIADDVAEAARRLKSLGAETRRK